MDPGNATTGDLWNFSEATTSQSVPAFRTSLTVLDICYIAAGVIGVLGNGLSCLVICLHRPLRRRIYNYCFINHCVMQLLMSILLIPTHAFVITAHNVYTCYLWNTQLFFVILTVVSIYSLVCVSVERFLEVVHPIWHRTSVTKARTIVILAGIWILSTFYKTVQFTTTTRLIETRCYIVRFYHNRGLLKFDGIAMISIEYLTPLVIISFCYISMWTTLRNKIRPGVSSAQRTVNLSQLSRVRSNLSKTLILVVGCFIICTSYRQIYVLLYHFDIVVLNNYYAIGNFVASLNCVLNPYIYFYKHAEFRRGARKIFNFSAKVISVENSMQSFRT